MRCHNGFASYLKLIRRSLRKDKNSQSREHQLVNQLLKIKDGKNNFKKWNLNGLKLKQDKSENNKKLMPKRTMTLVGHKLKTKQMVTKMKIGCKLKEKFKNNNDFLLTFTFLLYRLKKICDQIIKSSTL